MATRHRYYAEPDETEPLYGSTAGMQPQVEKSWDVFKDEPREPEVGSAVKTKYMDYSVKILKIVTMVVVFAVVLGSAVVSKGTALFMTSQIKKNVTRPVCNEKYNKNLQLLVSITEEERVTWIWFLIFTYLVPEFGTLFRSIRKCLFKKWEMPTFFDFISLLITESCPAIGSAILIFVVFPELDVIKAAMLTNAVCFIPGVVAIFSRNPLSTTGLKMVLDIISVTAQATSFVVWPLLENKPILYMIPVSVILISVGWWENYVSEKSKIPFIRELGKSKKEFKNKTYFLYCFVTPIKSLFFLITVMLIYYIREGDYQFLFDNFYRAFQDHAINITAIEPTIASSPNYQDAVGISDGIPIYTSYMTPIFVWLINFLSTYICYAFGKFACKVMIQGISFAFPVNLSVPVLLSGLIGMCGMFNKNECTFRGVFPEYLFFIPPPMYMLDDFISNQHAWVWLIWLLSQAWITIHVWSPNCDKLASTEQLFMKPMYDAFLIDQSLAMNRRRDETPRYIEADHVSKPREFDPLKVSEDKITRIFACGTMWHETAAEMEEFLKSIMRLDQDQSANRIVRRYLQIHLDSYYELETHIFFDDAFVRFSQYDNDPHVNEYVTKLVDTIDEAATKVHGTTVRIRPPKIYPTPYGGRLVWTLPGKTKLIAHLKDKGKIRAKKRWSQVMYMYYLLGHRLASIEELSNESKDLRAENTYILALDGDIDFQPEALHLLVDYMKKNKGLGAACGRIHPIGSGPMVWYQKFEYAVGHWLQKATEHVIGCVLCSPGCFSLFRGSALMDKSVMKKYTTRATEAKHFVQYDQGEDRWLCTLMLQRGYRVEYSAASDAYTHCPEGFNEFYNQRRRWMPSTIANIMDLLMDYKHTVKVNENISMLYIFYQFVLMVGTALGPGTIFLMLVGAFVAAFGLDQWSSLLWNLTPVLIFIIVCATCSADIQLFFAGIISAVYGLIMMAVVVGIFLQISADGILAPSSLFFFCVAGEFIIAAFLHPKEFSCLYYGVIYYVTVPSMYMLLVIYSCFNMNNVSWGTRDVTVVPKQDTKQNEEESKPTEQKKENKILTFLGANAEDDEGAFEFSLNKLFKCMFCTYKADNKESEQLKAIQDSIKELNKKLESLEKTQNTEISQPRRKNTMTLEGSKALRSDKPNEIDNILTFEDNISLPSEDVPANSWFYDGGLVRGEVHYLDQKEKIFWNDLLEKYLHPIDDDKDKVSKALKDLRDQMVFAFLMINSLFVLVIFLLTLEKDTLHLNWPFDPKVNFTYNPDLNEITLQRTYLQLEPIGFVFLIFFALLLVVQFMAMIIHRFGTYSQIITNTRLEIDMCSPDIDEMTTDEIQSRDPLKIAKDLQQLKGINDDDEDKPEAPVGARKTQSNLLNLNHRQSKVQIFDLDTAFKTRLDNSNDDDADEFRRKSIAFVKQRRSTVVMRRQSQLNPINEGIILDNNIDSEDDIYVISTA